MCISTVVAEEVHTFNTPRSRRKFVFTAAAYDWVFVMRAHSRYVHHGSDHEIWREGADTALLKEK